MQVLLDAEPRADILVNNLGIFEPKEFLDIPRRRLAADVRHQRDEQRPAVPGLPARHAGHDTGRIVFVSSESALQIPPEMIHYGVTKIAQLALSRGSPNSAPAPASR